MYVYTSASISSGTRNQNFDTHVGNASQNMATKTHVTCVAVGTRECAPVVLHTLIYAL